MNKNEIQKKIMDSIHNSKINAESKASQNFKNAMKNEEIKNLFNKKRTLDFQIAEYESQNKITKNLQEEKTKVSLTLVQKLNELGYKKAMFKPQYSCQLCKDTGKINGADCICFKKKYYEELFNQSGIPSHSKHTFKDYNISIATEENQQKHLKKIEETFSKFTQGYPNVKSKIILLSGKTGVGKTFLMECIANELIQKNSSVCFVTAFEMNNLFLKYHTTFTDDKNNYLNTLLDPDVLFIDDLGTEPILKNVTLNYLYTIISERLNANKTTFISTNLNTDDILKRYAERIFSRLTFKTNSLLINMQGEDLRHSVKK